MDEPLSNQLSVAHAQIRVLKAALLKACDGWEYQYECGPEVSPLPEINKLRALTYGR